MRRLTPQQLLARRRHRPCPACPRGSRRPHCRAARPAARHQGPADDPQGHRPGRHPGPSRRHGVPLQLARGLRVAPQARGFPRARSWTPPVRPADRGIRRWCAAPQPPRERPGSCLGGRSASSGASHGRPAARPSPAPACRTPQAGGQAGRVSPVAGRGEPGRGRGSTAAVLFAPVIVVILFLASIGGGAGASGTAAGGAAAAAAAAGAAPGAVAGGTSAAANEQLGASLAAAHGWTGTGADCPPSPAQDCQLSCLDWLWTRESGWSQFADTRLTGAGGDHPGSAVFAYGIAQARPATKYPLAGRPPDLGGSSDPATQISWGLGYIAATYGTPCAAWAHEESQPVLAGGADDARRVVVVVAGIVQCDQWSGCLTPIWPSALERGQLGVSVTLGHWWSSLVVLALGTTATSPGARERHEHTVLNRTRPRIRLPGCAWPRISGRRR